MNATQVLKGLPPPEAWKSLLLARGPRIATWVLGVAIAVYAAVIVTDLAGGSRIAPVSDAGAPPPLPASQRLDLVSLVNAHLFGEAKVAAGDPTNAPQTSMPLVLAGIIANSDPQRGFALIGESAVGAKVFSVGSAVPGGAKLHAVYNDRVVLDRNGALETLALPRQPRLGGTSAPPPMASAAAENPIIDRMRRMIEEDPGLLGDVMRPQPVFADGKQRGYRIYPGRNRAAFSKLGLRAGDLVTAINGTPLDDPARGGEIFKTLGSTPDARVSVIRNGRQQDLTLNVAQVASDAQQVAEPTPGGAADSPSNDTSVTPPSVDNPE